MTSFEPLVTEAPHKRLTPGPEVRPDTASRLHGEELLRQHPEAQIVVFNKIEDAFVAQEVFGHKAVAVVLPSHGGDMTWEEMFRTRQVAIFTLTAADADASAPAIGIEKRLAPFASRIKRIPLPVEKWHENGRIAEGFDLISYMRKNGAFINPLNGPPHDTGNNGELDESGQMPSSAGSPPMLSSSSGKLSAPFPNSLGSTDLVALMEPIARELLGVPTKSSTLELRFGTRGSLSVNLQKGCWFDHESGEGGGVLELIVHRGLAQDRAASIQWIERRGFKALTPTSPPPMGQLEDSPQKLKRLRDWWRNGDSAKPGHSYITRKLGFSTDLREVSWPLPGWSDFKGADLNGWLMVPAYFGVGNSGELMSIQFIGPRSGEKLNAPAPIKGFTFTVGELKNNETAFVVEGVGHAWSLNAVTGYPAVVAFGASNIEVVAAAVKNSGAMPVIVPDRGKETDAARIAFRLACGYVELPEEMKSGSDVNDLFVQRGAEAVHAVVDAQRWPSEEGEPDPKQDPDSPEGQHHSLIGLGAQGAKPSMNGLFPQSTTELVSQLASGLDKQETSSLIKEVGIIPLGWHGGELVFWRRDFKRVVILAPKLLGSHQGLQCLAPTQNWEAWGCGEFKPQFASNLLINWSSALGDVDLSRVPLEDASPVEVRRAFLLAKLATSHAMPAPVVLAELLCLSPEWHGVVYFDEFSARTSCAEPPPSGGLDGPWTDSHDSMLAAHLSSKYGLNVSTKAAHDIVELLARKNPRHPLREYLNSLEWDGVPRLDTWLIDFAGAKDTKYVRAASSKTLIAASLRAFVPGSKVDTALVLEGAQGVKKSSLLRALVEDTSWFAEDLAGTIGGKDALQGLHGKWFVELSEIAAIKKGTVEDVKSFITRRVDNYRSPYGRRAVDNPRQCIFVGSVNPDADGAWLNDASGGRRFWPIEITKVDLDGLISARNQLWAEAVHRWKKGEQHWLTDSEEAVAKEEQKARLQENPWEVSVTLYLSMPSAQEGGIATAEIFQHAQGRTATHRDSRDLTRIAEVLRTLGWEKRKEGRGRVNRWFPGKPI